MASQETAGVAEPLIALERRPPRGSRRRGDRRARLVRYRWLYLMLVPGVVYFATFKYGPMYGIVIAFKDYVPFLGIDNSQWVGLKYFEQLFGSPDFLRILTNTLILAALKIAFAFPAPIVVALLLNEVRVTVVKRSIQTAIYIPHFLSWTIVASLTYLLFAVDSGAVTHLANGVFHTRFDFLADPHWFRPLIVLQSLWKDTGWGTIIYLAALAGVDPTLYEAARVDGANRWQQMRHVTLPAIRSTVVIMMILTLGHVLDTGFDQIFLMTNSLNRSVADVFDTFVYYIGITQGAFSYSTAIGLFKGVVGIVLVLGSNWLAKRKSESGLF
ncbi:ABC transporter permease [Dactylosporangium sp. McL0621]|uniref:ABC transporter permease n=1 Tax=Dactylosporangium sp. McL0621 TaxID=3415678 RepID=UPI003CECF34E